MEKYLTLKKSELKQLKITDFTGTLPDIKNSDKSKAETIADWLGAVLCQALPAGNIGVNNILPSKADFAYNLGVSIGTVQNALRILEDRGLVESKQCIGTLVKNPSDAQNEIFRKLVSKRDMAIDAVKRYILTGGFKQGAVLPSARTIATIIGFTQNTTRLALENLCSRNIICRKHSTGKDNKFVVMTLDFTVVNSGSRTSKTLVDMVVKDLENYISKNLKTGDRIPPHETLAKTLKTSIKTVHDALSVLINNGILLARRGRYGTSVIRIPNSKITDFKPENSIFAPAKDAAFYHYEKTQNYIKNLIAKEYEIGDKLPSIQEMAHKMDLSPNTIRKAFHNLAREGYLVFSRGRYGGTFVIDIPEVETQSFKWLAVSKEYVKDEIS